jgi:hypothetical protein
MITEQNIKVWFAGTFLGLIASIILLSIKGISSSEWHVLVWFALIAVAPIPPLFEMSSGTPF